MDEQSVIARRLKEARLAAGLSQERLGVMAGIDEFSASARMNQYERGVHVPNLQLISKIADLLSVPTGYFYTEDDQLAAVLQIYGKLNQRQRKKLTDLVKEFAE